MQVNFRIDFIFYSYVNTSQISTERVTMNTEQKRKSHRRQRSQSKLGEVLGPVSFSLSDPPIHKNPGGKLVRSTTSRKPSDSKVRELLGPISFSLHNERRIKIQRRYCSVIKANEKRNGNQRSTISARHRLWLLQEKLVKTL